MRQIFSQPMSFQKSSVLLVTLVITLLAPLSAAAIQKYTLTDQAVSSQVDRELLFDPVMPFNNIDVTTAEGIVELSGEVDNLMAKERATRLAETVRGVRSVVNRINVKPSENKSAGRLRGDVEKALLYNPATDSYELEVQARDNGKVILSGDVDSWQEKHLSERVAKSVSGVTELSSAITVTPADNRTASEITRDINQRLLWDSLVDDGLIKIDAVDGKVVLSGTVGSAAEKNRAIINAWVAGVDQVDATKLQVNRWARDPALRKDKYTQKADHEVVQAVNDALLYDPRVNMYDIEVAAENGVVTLRGVVDSVAVKQAAQMDARHTVGVVGVNTLIKVRPIADVSNKTIVSSVTEALQRNPFTTDSDIKVAASNHEVVLNGTVESFYVKAEAENVALQAKGVAQVDNNLNVDRPSVIVYDPYVYDWSIYDYGWYTNDAVVIKKSDWQIQQQIATELRWSPYVDRDDVSIAVIDGTATLTGEVDSWSEFSAASENAYEGGAETVINRLEVN